MAVYTTQAEATPPDDALNVFLEIRVLRDGQQIATFAGRFPKGMNDSVVLTEIEKRVQGLVDADSDRIAKEELAERANAIAAALDDRAWP